MTFIDQLITEQPLSRPCELEQLHIPKMILSMLLNDGRMGKEATNWIWYTKQPDLKHQKRMVLKTALWMRPENLPADIVQIGGHSMETIRNIMHGLFTQYEVGEHSLERVDFLTFEDQYHPMEMPEGMRECFQANLKNRIWLMIQMQHLVHSKYLKLLMGMECRYAENEIEAQVVRGQAAELYEQLIRAVTVILEETGVLLPMYDKALFSDATYAAIVKASQNIAAVKHFMQIQ